MKPGLSQLLCLRALRAGMLIVFIGTGAFAAEPLVSTAPSPPKGQGVRPVTPAYAAVAEASLSPWKPVFVGVELCEASTQRPRPIQVRAVRVDLHEPTIDFLVTPSNGEEPRDVAARTTTEFLSEFKCQVAINAGYFDPWAKQKGDPLDVRGLAISRGELYSRPEGWRFDTLLISKDHRKVWIVPAPVSAEDIAAAYNAAAGEDSVLRRGRYGFQPDQRSITRLLHPRSVVGISKDGRYLLIVAIDGRQPGYSEGTTKAETAEWLYKLGAYEAINFDGGGSTALAIEGPDGEPLLLNRPCGPPAGSQRRVGNHLGVFARKLPK